MTPLDDLEEVYRAINVKPIISAAGSTTLHGGTRTRPEVLAAMSKAARVMVHIDELNREAGKIIAQLTGAEAAFVSSGAAGGLVLQAAACIAGADPAKMQQLPDTDGHKNKIIIQRCHRFPYDQAYRVAGARLVDVGEGRGCASWQLEAAITERTAAVAYLVSPFRSRRALPLEQVCEIAHARDIPVIVDAASMLPPRANLRKYVALGADMVVFSGGKGVRGPQGTGILCGRADLIEAAAANANPRQFLGRPLKVAKEEVIGLITALHLFVQEDEEAENQRYLALVQKVVDALIEVPGLRVTVEQDEYDYPIPTARIQFRPEWRGLSRDQILAAMAQGDPPIYLHPHGNPDELAVDPLNLDEEDTEVIVRRLREELLKTGG